MFDFEVEGVRPRKPWKREVEIDSTAPQSTMSLIYCDRLISLQPADVVIVSICLTGSVFYKTAFSFLAHSELFR